MSAKRLAELNIRYNELRATLETVSAQRDTLADELLNGPHAKHTWNPEVATILAALVESGNVIGHIGRLS